MTANFHLVFTLFIEMLDNSACITSPHRSTIAFGSSAEHTKDDRENVIRLVCLLRWRWNLPGLFDLPPASKPGLFIAGIDEAVGKTVVACAMADVLTRYGAKVGVLKPFDTHAQKDRGNLVSLDAQALAHFARLDPEVGSLSMVAPITHQQRLDPALEMALEGQSFDPTLIGRSLAAMDSACDIILVEGIGGPMTPIDPNRLELTMTDLARELGYPVVVVTRADKGSLSRTATTIFTLRANGCFVAGIIINYYKPDHPDRSMQLTREFLSKMNRTAILATVPIVRDRDKVDVASGRLHDEVRAAMALTDWRRIAKKPRPVINGDSAVSGVGPDLSPGPGRKVTFIPPQP